MKVALVQLLVGQNKNENLRKVTSFVQKAIEEGAKMIVLPVHSHKMYISHLKECFNSTYGVQHFSNNAEYIPQGPSTQLLCSMAKKHNVTIVGGTIPERKDGRIYNTCSVVNEEGNILCTYSKMHLFDVDIPGKFTFRESEVISPGSLFTSFPLKPFKIGLGICYDLRFPEHSAILTHHHSTNVLVYPAAFTAITGALHWHLLARSRAVDNQSYVLMASPARSPEKDSFQAYGHSMVVDPRGVVVAEAGEGEEIVFAELDCELVEEVRRNIPSLKQKRLDLYTLPRIID